MPGLLSKEDSETVLLEPSLIKKRLTWFSFRNISLSAAVFVLFFLRPLAAERLRISPDDLRLRVSVSKKLSPSLRQELRELAHSNPLPLRDGLSQSEQIFSDNFGSREWNKKKTTLAQYYFLLSRMKESQKFSDEFIRREELLKTGNNLLKGYIDQLNRLIARAVFTQSTPAEIRRVQEFPLHEARILATGELKVLHLFPEVKISMGRKELRRVRRLAKEERKVLSQRLRKLRQAEKKFLAEVSSIGAEIYSLRSDVRRWVKPPGEGLPFSL